VSRDGAAIVRELLAAFTRRDVEAAVALTDPAAELWPSGTAELAGRSEPYRGHDGMRQYFADLEQVWDELSIEPGEFRVAGSGVVAFGNAHGRPAGATENMTIPVIWVFRLHGDRVASARVVATAAEADAALQSRRAG
jgi:ketosteroid isomerase-like protein